MYTTLNAVKEQLRQESAAASPLNDAFVMECIDTVKVLIDSRTMERFAPEYTTEYYNAADVNSGGEVVVRVLWLRRGLISATEVSNAGTAVALNRLLFTPKSDRHKTRIHRLDGDWTADSDGIYEDAISITGLWCYRFDYTRDGWLWSTDTVQTGINASVTAITVADADGTDYRLRAPRFSPGQLLRIGSEFVQVRAVNTSTNTLTVIRAANGSTAAVHDAGAEIDVWQPDATIAQAATRWAAYLYRHRAQFAQTQVDGMTAIQWPKNAPSDVEAIIEQFGWGRGFGGV